MLFVKPGMSSVVGRTRGVEVPEFCLMGMGSLGGASLPTLPGAEVLPVILGLLGAVVSGVSFKAMVAPVTSGMWPFIAAAREPPLCERGGFLKSAAPSFCGGRKPFGEAAPERALERVRSR